MNETANNTKKHKPLKNKRNPIYEYLRRVKNKTSLIMLI